MANPTNNKKKKSNYFTTNIERIGENFLDYKNSKDIYYDCPNIFRQLARKQIELDKYGHFFFDLHFLNACIDACNEKAMFASISFNAMQLYCQVNFYNKGMQQIPQEILYVMDTHKNSWRAYATISYYLTLMRSTGCITYLYNLVEALNNPTLRNGII